jgi:tetratricopeptide (TPR) repeat protein
MSVKVASSRFIASSKSAELYQRLISGISSIQALGERLINEAETAQAFRHIEKLNEFGVILSNLPLQEYQLVGQYYLSWCWCRKGEDIRKNLEPIIENSTRYRARALIDLGTIEANTGDFSLGLRHYTQAVKYASDTRALSQAVRSIAAIKGLEGFHKQSWKDLERIYPLIKYSQPIEQYQYLNSLAIELSEVGRIEEALKVSRITLASPYAFAYPEWRETEQDLALRGYKSRSSVRVKTIPGNLLYLPEREVSDTPVIQDEDARLFDLEEWKDKKMVKEPNGDDETNPDKMTEQDMVMKLIQMLTTGEGDEKKIRELLKFALKTFYGK